jgi:hypothetical protein
MQKIIDVKLYRWNQRFNLHELENLYIYSSEELKRIPILKTVDI